MNINILVISSSLRNKASSLDFVAYLLLMVKWLRLILPLRIRITIPCYEGHAVVELLVSIGLLVRTKAHTSSLKTGQKLSALYTHDIFVIVVLEH